MAVHGGASSRSTTLPGAPELLEALGTPAALVDVDGAVIASNRAWRREAVSPSLLPSTLHEVFAAERSHFEVEVPMPDERQDRWVQVRATALASGALVVLHDVTARRMLEATLRGLGGHEGQTGLLDGGSTLEVLTERLTTARLVGRPVSLLQIEVEGLDRVRAELGDPVAAELMVEQVARVRRATRDGDVICRISDAAVLLVCTGLGEVGLGGLADRLGQLLAVPCTVSGREIGVSSTVGRVVVPPSSSALDALDALDADARRRRRTVPPVRGPRPPSGAAAAPPATAPTPPTAPSPSALVAGSSSAPVDVQFRLVVAAGDGTVAGVEVRGGAALGQATRSAARLLAAVGSVGRRDVAPFVVLPAPPGWEHDADRAFQQVRAAVDAAHLDPASVVLAISGAALQADLYRGSASLAQLRARGFRVLLDDVVAVSIPLRSLVGAPLDLVRIEIGTQPDGPALSVRIAVLRALLGAAGPLGLEVIAAGADLEADRGGLADLGARLVQGPPDDLRTAAEVLAEVRSDHDARGGRADGGGAPRPDRTEDLDAMFRAMAHEIRTPLTVTMGYASLLEASDDPSAASAAAHIRRASGRIEHLLRNVEDVRAIDQGDLRLALREVDVDALVGGLVEEHRELFAASIDLVGTVGGDERWVAADELRIVQVLVNLLSNAVKFSPAGETVEVATGTADGWVEVRVADRGPGLRAAHLPRAFAKYGRGDTSRPGSGLGLYLAQGIARAHGGDISYRPRAGGGSVFALVLPTSAAVRPASSDEALRRPSTDR